MKTVKFSRIDAIPSDAARVGRWIDKMAKISRHPEIKFPITIYSDKKYCDPPLKIRMKLCKIKKITLQILNPARILRATKL